MKEVQIKIGERVLYNASWKRMLYMLCFCVLGIVDQRTMTCGNDVGNNTFRLIGAIMIAAIILSHYKWGDIVRYKKYHMAWSIFAGIAFPVFYVVGRSWHVVAIICFLTLLAVFIWGYVVILTFTGFVIEKKQPRLNKKPMAVWAVMMLLMVFSRYNSWWPISYFIMFLCFYLTDFNETERTDFFEGALNGIILIFIIFQGLCFLYRPYDSIRYNGLYTNCNNNAIFYVVVLTAALTKLYGAVNSPCENGKKLKIYYFLGTEVVLSFIIMTAGRAAMGAAFVMIVFTSVFLYREIGKKALLQTVAAGILCLCLIFPVCFAAARYIPPLRHHPIWFDAEWNESKVHSWDPWDSEKYVELNEVLMEAFGRMATFAESMIDHLFPALKAAAAEPVAGTLEVSVLDESQSGDAVAIRGAIYRHYWKNLNWRGHTKEEVRIYLLPGYLVQHAHNIFLQFGTDFGIPVMILFAVMIIWPLAVCTKRLAAGKNASCLGSCLWLLIPLTFGMFEYSWRIGTMPIFTLFFAWRDIFWEEEQ